MTMPKIFTRLAARDKSIGLVIFACLSIACLFWLSLFVWHASHTHKTAAPIVYPANLWASLPGGVIENNKLRVTPLQRSIVKQDGSEGQVNPAVNIGGPAVSFSGDFSISHVMDLSGEGTATMLYYSSPPIIYDEWRRESASLAVSINESGASVSLWDGSSGQPASIKSTPLNNSGNVELKLSRKGNNVIVALGSTKLADIPTVNLFASGNLWFGAGASNKSWVLNKTEVSSNDGQPVTLTGPIPTTPDTNPESLASLASKKRSDFRLGAAVSLFPLLSNKSYNQLTAEFSSITPENDMKPQFIHPEANRYSFAYSDLLVKAAEQRHQVIHGHTLVFGEANPAWMQQTSLAQRKQVMTDHITTVVGRYKGRVAEWDVINEPLSDEDTDYTNGSQGLRHHVWFEAMGESYIAEALKAARQADPNAKLYINDYGLEADGERWTALLALISRLQTVKVPLDGIGFEAHVYEDGDEIDTSVLAKHFQTLARSGLLARISEMDVHGEDPTFQAEQYSSVLQTCLLTANCTSFTTWGISDAFGSTTEQNSYPLLYGNDLLWDKDFEAKLAVTKIQQMLNTK